MHQTNNSGRAEEGGQPDQLDLQHHHHVQQPRVSAVEEGAARLLGVDFQHLQLARVARAQGHDCAHHQLTQEGYAPPQ